MTPCEFVFHCEAWIILMQEIKTTVTQYSCSLWQYFSAFMIVDTSLFLRSEGLIMAGKYMCFFVSVCVCVCVQV